MLLSPVKTRGYRVELVRLSVRPSVCPSVRLSVRLSVPLDIGYFVHASLIWRSWARAFKCCTRMNQVLKSCLVKVLSRSVENCRFWSTLKIVDFKLFSFAKHFVHASLGWRSWARVFQILYTHKPRSEVVPRQGFISIGLKLSILEHFKNCRF